MTRKQSQQHDAQRKPSWRVRWKTMSRAVGMEIREHKSSFAVYVVLRMLVLAMAILQFFNGDYENVFLCILTLLLLLAAGVHPGAVPHRAAFGAGSHRAGVRVLG